jgi:hypothetical protein
MDGAEPRLEVRPVSIGPGPEAGTYQIRWRLDNLNDEPVEVLESWLPHSQFLAPREGLQPPLALPLRGSRFIARVVRLQAEPGQTIENAFLNLRVQYRGEPWRVLVRMRVEHPAPDSVSVNREAISAHRVGFAGAS